MTTYWSYRRQLTEAQVFELARQDREMALAKAEAYREALEAGDIQKVAELLEGYERIAIRND